MKRLLFLFATFTVFVSPYFVRAQAKQNPAALEACKDQVELYCNNSDKEQKQGPGEKLKCLFKHHESLSVSCKQELQRIFKASRQTAMAAGGDLGLLGGLAGMGGPMFAFSYDGRYVPGVKRGRPLLMRII